MGSNCVTLGLLRGEVFRDLWQEVVCPSVKVVDGPKAGQSGSGRGLCCAPVPRLGKS